MKKPHVLSGESSKFPVSGLALAVAMCSAAANAQELVLEEVIVTAQKRVESLQDVPVAIQAISGADLESAGITDIGNIDQITPSLTINDSTGYMLPAIRGVGSTNQGGGNYSSVAVYVDDVYVPRTTSTAFSLLNVEQVQVLRGPQGALYGRNATGGAIVVTTKTPMPGDEFEGRISAGYGNFDNKEFGVYLASGLGDKWAASFSASVRDRDGFVESLTPGTDDLDGRDSSLVMGKLVFTPTDNTTLELALWYDDGDDTNSHGYQQLALEPEYGPLNGAQAFVSSIITQFLGDPALGLAVANNLRFDDDIKKTPNNEISGFTAGPGTYTDNENAGRLGAFTWVEDQRASFRATVEFESFDFLSITAVTDHHYQGATELLAALPGSITEVLAIAEGDNAGFTGWFETESVSQEFRLVSTEGNFDWLLGAHYFQEEGDNRINADFFGLSFRQADNEWEVESWAVFGQLRYPLTDNLNITGGLRYTDETYELNDLMGGSTGFADVDGPIFEGIALPGTPSVQMVNAEAPGTFPEDQDFSATTFSLILDWTIDDWMLYGGINTGFKSGNLNANNPLSGGVDEEEITAYEVGFKSDLGDGRYRFNGAVFFYEYDNIHIQVINQASGATVLLNGSDAEILGAELEFTALVTDGLTFTAGLTALDSEYKDDLLVPDGGGLGIDTEVAIKGNNLAGAPELNATLSLEHVLPLGGGELVTVANALISDGYFFEAENRVGTGEDGDGGSYSTVNGSITYRYDNWSFSLWGNNLFDEEYFSAGVVANGLLEVGVAGAPRHYGATVSFEF